MIALEHDWRFYARGNQRPPDGDWLTWLFLAGRGAGKTRSGAEWVRAKVKALCRRIALIAPTASDARDIMVEGESGILQVCWGGDVDRAGVPMGRPVYEPSKRRLTWANGAIATLYSAEEPERLRGPQHDALWADELAAWKYQRDTWDMAMFGLRLGDHPQATVTTTPKPQALIRELIASPDTIVSTGSTFDNAANLAPSYLAKVRSKYEGTRLGRQELYAEILGEAEGALWSRDTLDQARFTGALPEMRRVVVAIDPAVSEDEENGAETGIVVAGMGVDGFGYVLEDASGRYSPRDWAQKAIALYHRHGADRLVAEGNQGGVLVRHTIETEWEHAPITIIHASRGKVARAEPVAALYEQGRVRHAGAFPNLEDQMVNWEPVSGNPSPDRLDALVWALTEVVLKSNVAPGLPIEHLHWTPFAIPPSWKRAFGLAESKRGVSAVWLAEDPVDGVLYAYAEYVSSETSTTQTQAIAVKSRGDWIRGALVGAKGATKADLAQTVAGFRGQGVQLATAPGGVEAGLTALQSRVETGRLRVFNTLQQLGHDWARYRRNDKGELDETDVPLMAALRVALHNFEALGRVKPAKSAGPIPVRIADKVAGY